MTKSRVWIGCGLAAVTPVLFVAIFIVAGVESFKTGPLVAGHIPVWCLLLGLTFVSVGAVMGLFNGPHVLWGRTATGRVVEVRPAEDSDEEPEVVIRYAVGGTSHEFTTNSAGRSRGDAVKVSYLPWEPGDGRVADLVPVFGLVFPLGFGFGGIAVVLFWLFA